MTLPLEPIQRRNQTEVERRALNLRAQRKKEGKSHPLFFMVRNILTNLPYRLMQNRVSAFRFRIKRKQEFDVLKGHVNEINDEN